MIANVVAKLAKFCALLLAGHEQRNTTNTDLLSSHIFQTRYVVARQFGRLGRAGRSTYAWSQAEAREGMQQDKKDL